MPPSPTPPTHEDIIAAKQNLRRTLSHVAVQPSNARAKKYFSFQKETDADAYENLAFNSMQNINFAGLNEEREQQLNHNEASAHYENMSFANGKFLFLIREMCILVNDSMFRFT